MADGEPTQRGRIAIVGDLHSAWTELDVDHFNRSTYELLLFAGDLGASGRRDGLRIASSISRLMRPALVMPGNNDVEQYALLSAELTYRRTQSELLRDLELGPRTSGGAMTCGFSSHAIRIGELDLTIIAGRPFSAGGGEASFAEALDQSFGVRSLSESAERLCALIDQSSTEHLIFFAHNGPSGLGSEPDALWGCDFRAGAGDWGDPDLRTAIVHASERKRRTLAVVAGHMHWRLRRGGQRRWRLQREGILYVNSARVPRIFDSERGTLRQHLALSLHADGASVEEVVVPPV